MMEKVVLTNRDHLSQIRMALEDRIIYLSGFHDHSIEARIQQCFDAYLRCDGYLRLEQLRGWAKPKPKGIREQVKEFLS